MKKRLLPEIYKKTSNEPYEIVENQNDQNLSLFSTYDEIEKFKETNDDNLIKYLYFNRIKIFLILYVANYNMKIDYKMTKNNLSNLLYVILLLESDENLNFVYSFDFISNVYNKLKQYKSQYGKILLSIILFKIISYYKESLENEENEEEEKTLEEIEKYIKDIIKKNNNIIKEFTSNLNENNLKENDIEILYSDIIKKLIITNQIDNNDIIKELDLDNMNITKEILNEIKKILNDNNYMNNYKIEEIKDLNDNNKINFYFNLFKHILKIPLYIYHIPFLHKTKKNIIKLIKANTLEYKIINNKEAFKYVFNFFMDTKYYEEKYLNNSKGEVSIKSISSVSTNRTHIQNISNDNDDNYSFIKFKRILKSFEGKEAFIKEMKNGKIIIGGEEDKFYIYDKNMENFVTIGSPVKVVLKQDNSETRSSTHHNKSNIFKKMKKIKNITESNKRKLKKNENDIQMFICSKNAVTLFTIDNKIEKKEQLDIPCSKFFEIIDSKGDIDYIIIGEKGIKHFRHFSRFSNSAYYYDEKKSFANGIILNKKFLVLISNSILPNGNNKLWLYDIKEKNLLEHKKEINHSFNKGVNGLLLMKLENNKEILLCACKKYTKDGKNGIEVIDSEVERIDDINSSFFNTYEFEVSCFCPITKKENDKILPTNYILVGGFDTEKREGMIKLYRIIITSNKSDKFSCYLEFLQDIVIEITNDFDGFKGTVNCMILTKHTRDLIVGCWDGNVYCFSEPNISYYIKENNYFVSTIYKN